MRKTCHGSRKVLVRHELMYRHGRLLRVARTSCLSRSSCFRGPALTLGQRRYQPTCETKGFSTSTNFELNISVRDNLPVHFQGLYIWIQVNSITTDGPMPKHKYSFALGYDLLQQVLCSRFARPFVYEKIMLTINTVSNVMWNMCHSSH